MKLIDRLLDSITMYRLVLYYLIGLLVVAELYSFLGILPFNPYLMGFSIAFLLAVSWTSNQIFSQVFAAPTNVESVYISALILALIISPVTSVGDVGLLFWAALLTTASKYMLAINKKHLFNPVAIAVVLTAVGFNGMASWWVGSASLLPFSLVGLLIVRKIRRSDLVFAFFAAALTTILGFTVARGGDLTIALKQVMLSSPLVFFACVMLTEPLTTPPTHILQSVYGAIVGLMVVPQFHFGPFTPTPELALVMGNIFSYAVSPKDKIVSVISDKIKIAPDMMDFLITTPRKLAFYPGQYMEWTIPHQNPDSRGNRRYFTIASSPTEDTIRLGVKFYNNGSSYKEALRNAGPTMPIVGAQLSGDFTMPQDPRQKLAFIAGGIGITPFRSMIKYLVDINQRRPIILLYANRTADEIIYRDVFDQAHRQLGIKTVYTVTDTAKIPHGWRGRKGRIDDLMIRQEIPDFRERTFYLSGPHVMVTAYQEVLKKLGLPESQIKIDYFPGFV